MLFDASQCLSEFFLRHLLVWFRASIIVSGVSRSLCLRRKDKESWLSLHELIMRGITIETGLEGDVNGNAILDVAGQIILNVASRIVLLGLFLRVRFDLLAAVLLPVEEALALVQVLHIPLP